VVGAVREPPLRKWESSNPVVGRVREPPVREGQSLLAV
jgi:hypothetical protein